MRRTTFLSYAVSVIVCLAGALALPLLGWIGYGDRTSYRLYGTPWDHNGFPWYVAYSFRSISIALHLLIGGVAFVPLYIGMQLLLARLVARRTANGVALIRTGSALMAIALVVILYAAHSGHSR